MDGVPLLPLKVGNELICSHPEPIEYSTARSSGYPRISVPDGPKVHATAEEHNSSRVRGTDPVSPVSQGSVTHEVGGPSAFLCFFIHTATRWGFKSRPRRTSRRNAATPSISAASAATIRANARRFVSGPTVDFASTVG